MVLGTAGSQTVLDLACHIETVGMRQGKVSKQANVTPNQCLRNILLRRINSKTAWSCDALE